MATDLENQLKAEIISAVLRPGDRLRVNSVANRFRVSATPVREALQHLAEQGLVQIHPQIGARVAPINVSEMSDLYSVRATFEAEATKRAVIRGDLEWLAAVMDAWEGLRRLETSDTRDGNPEDVDAATWIKAHRDFHRVILSACGSPLMLRFIESLYDHSARYQSVLRGDPVFVRDSPTEHADLVDTILKREADKAAAIVETQLALASLRLLQDLKAYTGALDSPDIMEGETLKKKS